MSEGEDTDPSAAETAAREAASRIAEAVAPLLREARAEKYDFLAYLLGMALKEARRLASQ